VPFRVASIAGKSDALLLCLLDEVAQQQRRRRTRPEAPLSFFAMEIVTGGLADDFAQQGRVLRRTVWRTTRQP
jgi:hypothetical protein